MGSVQSKIRRVLKKRSKKSRDGGSRPTNLPQGPPLIYLPNEPNQAHVNTTYQATHSRTNLPQGPPSVFMPDRPNSALDTLQQQVNTTYQDTGDVLRESEIPSGLVDTADAASYRPILPSQQSYAAHSSSLEMERETPQLEHEVPGVGDGDLLTNPEDEIGTIERYCLVSSPEVVDTEKAKNSRLWGEAIERLKKKAEIEGLTDFERGVRPVQRLLEEVENRRTIIETQRICYRNRQGEEVPVSDVIFRELNNYASIGDIALQHHPDVVALVWSGFRLLLQVGTSYVDNLAMILNSVGYLAWIICCGALYEDLYVKVDTKCSEEIRDCLVTQYVSILTYLSYANEHLKGSKTERIFESLSPQLSQLLESIRDSEKMIKERSDMAEKEAANAERSKQEVSRRNLKYIREHLENVKSAVNECNTKLSKLCKVADETIFHNTLDWVCNIQYGKIHEEHKAKRTADTCLWLERNSIFQEWVNCRSSSAVLWLRGAAGTGKTILASSIIGLLGHEYKRNRSLAYFYCSITSPDRILPESVLRAITKQLCHEYSGGKLKLPKKLVEIKDKRVRESAGLPSLEECADLIIELSNYLSSGVWIVIDALDECDGNTRKNLFCSLDKIVTGGKDIRVFLTGRDEADIRGYMMQRHENYLIDPSDNASDIELYIKSELKGLYDDLISHEVGPELITQFKKLEEENIRSLKENANGMFLSVHLRMKALRMETTLHGMQKAIKDFPKSLNTVYTDILDRISRQSDTDSTCAHEILKWLFYAVDDFSADTILEALRHSAPGKGSGNTKPKARNVRNAQNICCGLVIHDEKTGVLRFSHATVKEYLEILNGPGSCISGGHEFMSDICLRILSTSNYRIDEECTDDTSGQAFINYATRNWGNHVRHCESRDSCQDFLKSSSSSYKAWSSKAIETVPVLRMKETPGGCVDLVWVACYYRLLNTLKGNLETIGAGCVNAAGRTPLHHCAEHGYMEFVKHLVQHKDIDVNAEDDMKRTPLLLAIISNQVGVVETLLKHSGLKIDTVDQDGRTALMHASLIGSDKIVQLLLDSAKCDVNVADTEGYTALHHATLKGHQRILDLLFRVSSLNINLQSQDGSTALSLAAQADSNIAIMEKLLSFQISSGPALDPNLRNHQSETPLLIATGRDQQKIAERLIQDERVDINCGLGEDNMFIKAADSNKAWLVKLLVARVDDLDINRRGINGWTALSNAVRYNALDAFRYIVAFPGVDIECKDSGDGTLLQVATERGRADMVSELLAHGANASTANQGGQTPLIIAANHRYLDVFKALIAHYDKAQPQDRVTQFLGAVESDDEQIMQLIHDQKEKGYDINQRDESGKTELMVAAANGLTNTVQTLLKKPAIEVNAVDDEGESALSLAILKGHTSAIDALVEYRDIEIKLPAHSGTALPQWVFE
ncbi:ankyrin [Morchella conica CCBAS932]|uniref:Ankyrin n=1 Tax=Morchella conica CCBAS932 TaxID=1392247 RepID=A0A3N4K908_9PEZI|nr:ankyrin [Morchella conica CCBAS932]